MESEKERIERLEAAYRKLWSEHEDLKNRIKENYAEFKQLREAFDVPEFKVEQKESVAPVIPVTPVAAQKTIEKEIPQATIPVQNTPATPKAKSSWEEFIGEQLLSKIGIAIVIIGVGIGAKYAIDHDLVGVGMRVMGGYFISLILGFFAFRLKKKYHSFSAVLASGALAIAYFMTYASYAFYGIIPVGVAFAGLLLVVAATVFVAMIYDLVIIAHIALIGAYVIPPLVSTGGKHMMYYLSYMLVINLGMITISFLKSWKTIHYPIIAWTALIFLIWFNDDYVMANDAGIAILFNGLFYLVFTFALLGRSLVKKEPLLPFQQFEMLLVSGMFFIILNYCAINISLPATFAIGFLTVGVNALVFVFAKSKGLSDVMTATKLLLVFNVMMALGLFIGDIYFSGICYLIGIGALWIGSGTNRNWLVILGIIVSSIFAFLLLSINTSLLWGETTETPFNNDYFNIAVFISLAHLSLLLVSKRFQLFAVNAVTFDLSAILLTVMISLIGVIQLIYQVDYELHLEYLSKHEFTNWWEETFTFDLREVVAKNKAFAWIGIVALAVAVFRRFVFQLTTNMQVIWKVLLMSMLGLAFLGLSYTTSFVDDFKTGDSNFSVFELSRYLVFAAFAFFGWSSLRSKESANWELAIWSIGLLWVLSLELVHWSVWFGFGTGYKIMLSLLWGVYAILMIISGLKRKVPVLRITAMVILGVMVVKLFTYDLNSLSTIIKTIVFVLIGGLLLVGAYFYQQMAKAEKSKVEDE